MIAFIKRLLWDEAAFERYGRALLMAAALYLGQARDLPPWAIAVGGALALLIGAGDKNPKARG